MRTSVEIKHGDEVVQTLHVIAPDEAQDDEGRPVWKVIIEGSTDPVMATEGLSFRIKGKNSGFLFIIRSLLYDHVSSSLVERHTSEVNDRVTELLNKYDSTQTG